MFLFQFLCNLQQYCDSAYNKLNSHSAKRVYRHNKNELYLEEEKKTREKETNTHELTHSRMHARPNTRTARTHARAPPPPPHTHTHTQFQTKIQAIKRPNKQIKDDPNKIVTYIACACEQCMSV